LPELVFVFGIMHRSGTNYLRDLLTLHEQCRGSRIHEDFLVANSCLLERYVDAVIYNWNSDWFQGAIDEEVAGVAKALGSGLEAFCGIGGGRAAADCGEYPHARWRPSSPYVKCALPTLMIDYSEQIVSGHFVCKVVGRGYAAFLAVFPGGSRRTAAIKRVTSPSKCAASKSVKWSPAIGITVRSEQ
jgi:hypothetical protein